MHFEQNKLDSLLLESVAQYGGCKNVFGKRSQSQRHNKCIHFKKTSPFTRCRQEVLTTFARFQAQRMLHIWCDNSTEKY